MIRFASFIIFFPVLVAAQSTSQFDLHKQLGIKHVIKFEEKQKDSGCWRDTSYYTKYDKAGLLEQSTGYWYYTKKKQKVSSYYKYDSLARKTEMKTFSKYKYSPSTIRYFYDSIGNEILRVRTRNDDVGSCTEYRFDDFGNEISNFTYKKNGNLSSAWYFKYNENNQMIEEMVLSKPPDTNSIKSFEWEKGVRTYSRIQYRRSKDVREWFYKYDDRDNLVEKRYILPHFSRFNKYIFDVDGNQIGDISRSYGREGLRERVDYTWSKYDTNGLIIEEVKYFSEYDLDASIDYVWSDDELITSFSRSTRYSPQRTRIEHFPNMNLKLVYISDKNYWIKHVTERHYNDLDQLIRTKSYPIDYKLKNILSLKPANVIENESFVYYNGNVKSTFFRSPSWKKLRGVCWEGETTLNNACGCDVELSIDSTINIVLPWSGYRKCKVKSGVVERVIDYDLNGNRIHKFYLKNGKKFSLSIHSKQVFNKRDSLIEAYKVVGKNRPRLECVYSAEFNENAKVKSIRRGANGDITRSLYTYIKDTVYEQIINESILDTSVIRHVYEDGLRIFSMAEHSINPELGDWWEYFYDEDKRLIKTRKKYTKEDTRYYWVYKYYQ